jgi:basic amino acid/polyamine antiporter, APA family
MIPETPDPGMRRQPTLKRTLSLPMMLLYGLGATIGAGIYVLIGDIAGIAGYYAPVSFLVASLMAGFTAASYAELSARLPFAAGSAIYVWEGTGSKHLSLLVGLLVIIAGLVSSAALLNGFVAYLNQFIALDRNTAIALFALLLGAIAAWGIAESVAIAGLITLIEVGGLVLVIVSSHDVLATLPARWHELIPPFEIASWGGIYAAALLSFYAFIGFEDMVVVAEEVRDVEHKLPLAILLTLVITTVLYMSLMITAVLTLQPQALAASEVPLARVYQLTSGGNADIINVIAMFAIINGVLIQIIMASRMIYGLSVRGRLPGWLGAVNRRTRTPLIATAIVTVAVLTLALIGRLTTLAEATSLIMLAVFMMVNFSLLRIKRRQPRPTGIRVLPLWVPIAGMLFSAMFVLSGLSSIF